MATKLTTRAQRIKRPSPAHRAPATERQEAKTPQAEAQAFAPDIYQQSSLGDALAHAPDAARAGAVMSLQQTHGNAAVQRFLAMGSPAIAGVPTATVPTSIEAEGSTGSAPLQPVVIPFTGGGGEATPARTNEWGEIDGGMVSSVVPTAFVSKGKTGSGAVHWGGGNGGVGGQGVGSIDVTAPVYEGRDEIAEVKDGKGKVTTKHKPARAWIKAGTGKAKVTRSYRGVLTGANGGGYFITRKAAARIDVHEMKHVNSSKALHGTNIKPLEKRVAKRVGTAKGLESGTTTAEATTALQAEIDWNTSVTAFSSADTTANTPGGSTDTTDSSSANFYFNYGPRKVKGTDYTSYIDTPPGPK
jgi:hypothetical protein